MKQEFDGSKLNLEPSDKKSIKNPAKEKPDHMLVIPPPTLGVGGKHHPMASSTHSQKEVLAYNSMEEIKKWEIEQGTNLKNRHASQELELENQHKIAIESKEREIGEKFNEEKAHYEKIRDEIETRQKKGGISGLFYRFSGQLKEDQEKLAENENNFKQSTEHFSKEASNFKGSLEKEKVNFLQRREIEVENLKSEINQAREEKRIPNRSLGNAHENEHGEEGHTR